MSLAKQKWLEENHTIIQEESQHRWLRPVILATSEAEIRKIAVQRQPRQDPTSKITRVKWAGGMAQVVKQLLCKCKA
jgi:hypothetical protein